MLIFNYDQEVRNLKGYFRQYVYVLLLSYLSVLSNILVMSTTVGQRIRRKYGDSD